VLLALNGTVATLVVNNQDVFTHVFAPRVDADGFSYGLNAGMVGIGTNNSKMRIDNVAVLVLPPEFTFEETEEFPDTDATIAFVPEPLPQGDWQLTLDGEQYVGTATIGDTAVSLVDLGLGRGLELNAILELEATLNTEHTAGVVFDYYGPEDFKFAAIDAEADQLIIGHRTARQGWVYDAVINTDIVAGKYYDLNVSVKGLSVSVTLKDAGASKASAIVGYAFNAPVVDGDLGLLSKDGISSFDALMVRTNDSAFRDAGDNLMASAAPTEPAGAGSALSYDQLGAIVDEAIGRWSDSGLVDADDLSSLHEVTFQITDLSGLALAWTVGQTIMMDVNAAGHGWFVDLTPGDDNEFSDEDRDGLLVASTDTLASGRMDLLTVVMHEIGHVLGFEDLDAEEYPHDLMSATLAAGVRRLDIEADQSVTAGTDYNRTLYYQETPPNLKIF